MTEEGKSVTDEKLIAKPGSKVKLKDYDTKYTGKYTSKEEAVQKLENDILKLERYQASLPGTSFPPTTNGSHGCQWRTSSALD